MNLRSSPSSSVFPYHHCRHSFRTDSAAMMKPLKPLTSFLVTRWIFLAHLPFKYRRGPALLSFWDITWSYLEHKSILTNMLISFLHVKVINMLPLANLWLKGQNICHCPFLEFCYIYLLFSLLQQSQPLWNETLTETPFLQKSFSIPKYIYFNYRDAVVYV